MLPSVDCELWRGTVTQEASMERDEMIFVAGASMRMLVAERTNVLMQGNSIK